MKKIFTLTIALTFSLLFNAQYYYLPAAGPGNPGGLNTDTEYPNGSGLPAGWATILTGSNSSPTWSSTETIPFSFNFNGNAVTQYKVSSTGVLTFSTTAASAPASSNATIPNAAVPDNSVMVWGISGSGANDNIVTKTFGSAGSKQHWIFFASYSDDSGNWTYWSIVLEEGSDKIYVVDQRHSGSASPTVTIGIQVDASTAVMVAGSPNISNLAGTDATDADNFYYEFIPGQISADNIEMSEILTPTIAGTGTNATISGTITNMGSNTVTSLDITWDDGSGINSETISGLSIASYGTYSFNHSTTLSIANASTYSLNICAEITGVTDADPSDNCLAHDISGLAFVPTRHVVIEEGTGTWCGWCPRGAVAMESVTSDASRENFIGIAVHNGDAMTITAYDNGANFSGYPGMNVNRKYLGESVSTTAMQSFYDQASAEPTNANVDVSGTYDQTTGDLTVEVTATFAAEINTDHRLSAVLLENGVTGSSYSQSNYYSGGGSGNMIMPNSGSMPGFNFSTAANPVPGSIMFYDHVARELYGGYSGQANSITLPATANSSQSYTFNSNVGNYDPNNLQVVGFLINSATGEIMNANKSYVFGVGMEEKSYNDIKLYPNPANDQATIAINGFKGDKINITVTNLLGEVVLDDVFYNMNGNVSAYNIDLNSIRNGIYSVNLRGENLFVAKKLQVVK